jgi:hypothetical protein
MSLVAREAEQFGIKVTVVEPPIQKIGGLLA